jgi:predicted nucleotidyltransferase
MVIVISIPCVYGSVLSRTEMAKSDISKLVKSMENRIRKGFDLAIIVHSLRQVYFAKI